MSFIITKLLLVNTYLNQSVYVKQYMIQEIINLGMYYIYYWMVYIAHFSICKACFKLGTNIICIRDVPKRIILQNVVQIRKSLFILFLLWYL